MIFFAIFLGLFVLILALNLFLQGKISELLAYAKWIVASALVGVGILLLLSRQIVMGIFAASLAVTVIRRGRLGPINFNTVNTQRGNTSKVTSSYFAMVMDHDNSTIDGKVIAGQFARRDMFSLDEHETRRLLVEVHHDADSLALLESWLDANRTGWREYFAEQGDAEAGPSAQDTTMDRHQALDVLGLEDDASDDDIKAAHRRLLKAVHPDQGGSTVLAARINAARDYLLKA